MNLDEIAYADKSFATRLVEKLYPDAHDITFVEHTHDNLVVLVDETYALRFPRRHSAYLRSKYESHILGELKNIRVARIPRVVDTYPNPPCLITTFLHGRHLNARQVDKLTLTDQEQFARTVAKFAYELHSSLSVDLEKEWRSNLHIDEVDEPWDAHLKKTVYERSYPTLVQDKIAKEYYAKWLTLEPSKPVVAHDDLHTENMLFEGAHLVGILDFGDTRMGTPEQELRQLYRINETVLEIAIKTYSQLTKFDLNIESAKVWAIMQELAVYSEHLHKGDVKHPAFSRACFNLSCWLPDGEWGEGYSLDVKASNQ